MADEQVRRGATDVGPAEVAPLPQGSATQANQFAAQAPAVESQGVAPASAAPVTTGPPEPALNYRPANAEEAFLFGETERPGEPVTAGMTAAGSIAPPDSVHDWLPALREAAAMQGDPGADKAQLILGLVLHQMGQ